MTAFTEIKITCYVFIVLSSIKSKQPQNAATLNVKVGKQQSRYKK